MAIGPGSRLGPYEVTALIGEGGMGKVWRGHHTGLKRDDALKVLPEAFVADPDRLARFQREAQVLASLNHPNIAHVYGLERADGVQALVMELVEGPTLADRIAQGPIPVDEALPIAKQIAEALEAAHEQGIIHRDLKPANIKVRPDGTVKVLDFGLAKALGPPEGGHHVPDVTASPTITSPALMTGVGVLLGTAAYMSPEQARGKPVDKRSDIWAFGCVLFEMLTGKRAFEGEDVSDTLAAVLRAEPDWISLPAETPMTILRSLRRCLTKDPRDRLHDIADARLDIRDSQGEHHNPYAPSPIPRRRVFAWSVVGVLSALSTLLAVTLWSTSRETPANSTAYRSVIQPLQLDGAGKETPIANIRRGLALSPDGRRLAFVAAGSDGRPLLWVQPLDMSAAQPLRGTEDAATAISPTWSPDGRQLAFFADRTLKRIDAAGGSAIALFEGAARMFSPPTWNRDNVILFTGPVADGGLRILRVNAAGGSASAATSLQKGEVSHAQPYFLPDGNRFLFRVNGSDDVAGVYVGSLDSGERGRLISGNASLPMYGNGFLVYVLGTTLMAQAFDAQRLELRGEATPLAPSIRTGGAPSAGGSFSISQNGVLVYQADTADASQLVWLDRSGRETAALGDLAEFGHLQMAPNDDRVAVSVTDPDGNRDVWLYDTARGIPTRFTSDPADEFSAAWAPDGQSLVFASARDHAEVRGPGPAGLGLFQKPTIGTAKETLVVSIAGHEMPTSWSADGRFILYQTDAPNADLWVLPVASERKPIPFIVNTRFTEQFGHFSPNGRWIAYSSNETGRTEVYVAPFQHAGGTTRISSAGGGWPKWRSDGQEMFYVADDTLMAVRVRENGATLDFGVPQPLFRTPFDNSPLPYAVTSDGQRFLVNRSAQSATQAAVMLVVNWTALLLK